LTHYEKKKYKKKKELKGKGKGKLMGDGLPCFLSGDWFYEKVVEFEAWQREGERKKKAKKQACEEMAELIVNCKREEKKQKERNEAKQVRYKEAVCVWEKEHDAVREAKKKFAVQKPV
jgi:hypothetical protein